MISIIFLDLYKLRRLLLMSKMSLIDFINFLKENESILELLREINKLPKTIEFFSNSENAEKLFNFTNLVKQEKIDQTKLKIQEAPNICAKKEPIHRGETYFKMLLNNLYFKYGYLPKIDTITEELGNDIVEFIKKAGGYKSISKACNYVTETDVAKRFAYELDKINKIKCPYCGNDEVVRYMGSKNVVDSYGYKCKACEKRFYGHIYTRTILNQYFDYIRLEKNLSSDIKIIFYKGEKPNLITDNTDIYWYEILPVPPKRKKFVWQEHSLVFVLKQISKEYGYLPKFETLSNKYKLTAALNKFGGYKYIAQKYGFITEFSLKQKNIFPIESKKHEIA
jgi:predicted RNA-binding Zn-ribbon protein involved in translation (DUF1610 family)